MPQAENFKKAGRTIMQTIEQALEKLEKSRFRSSFHLTKKEQLYLEEKGMDIMRKHAEDFVRQKLAPADPVNDGKQTPMHGHPVFKAMHATACCCRGCLNKWYRVPLHLELTESGQQRIVNLLMAWIERNRSKTKENTIKKGEANETLKSPSQTTCNGD